MSRDINLPNGDFLKNYPKVSRVECFTENGCEFAWNECSAVQVSLQDDGQTIKLFLHLHPEDKLSPRQQLIKELDEKLNDAFQSDFEHGIKALNIAAKEEFNQKYPALIDVLEWIAFLSYEELPID